MSKWFLPMWLIKNVQRQADWSFVGKDPFITKGKITLYEKNSNTHKIFHNATKLDGHYGYSAERDKCPSGWEKVIRPLDEIINAKINDGQSV